MGFLEYKLKGLKYAMSPTIPLYFAALIELSDADLDIIAESYSAGVFALTIDVTHDLTVSAEAATISWFEGEITAEYKTDLTAEDGDGKQIRLTIENTNPVYCLVKADNEFRIYSNIQIDESYTVTLAPGLQWSIASTIEADENITIITRKADAANFKSTDETSVIVDVDNFLSPDIERFKADIEDSVKIEMGHDFKIPFDLGEVDIRHAVAVEGDIGLYRKARLADYRGKKLSELRGKKLKDLFNIKI